MQSTNYSTPSLTHDNTHAVIKDRLEDINLDVTESLDFINALTNYPNILKLVMANRIISKTVLYAPKKDILELAIVHYFELEYLGKHRYKAPTSILPTDDLTICAIFAEYNDILHTQERNQIAIAIGVLLTMLVISLATVTFTLF